MMRRKFCKIFYYLTAGHLLESKSLTEVLMCVMILLICSSFNLFTLELDVHHDGLDLIFLLPARNSTFFKLSILKQLVPPPLCCSHFPSTCCRRSENFYSIFSLSIPSLFAQLLNEILDHSYISKMQSTSTASVRQLQVFLALLRYNFLRTSLLKKKVH